MTGATGIFRAAALLLLAGHPEPSEGTELSQFPFAALKVSVTIRPTPEEAVVTRARGTFEVKLVPQTTAHDHAGAPLGRLSIDKEFRGDLVGTSKGEMLTAMTSVKESAGYVAIERVTGTLQGRSGSFVLQHSGTMTRGVPALLITVVPDSGTEGLTGIAGTMTILIADGKHSYEFEYSLPPPE